MKLKQFCDDKQLSTATCNFYTSAVKMYEEVTGLSLDELLVEADNEEFERVPWKYRKIREHLLNFRNYLFGNRSEGTAKRYFAGIKTIYTHFEVELHSLPSFNSKQIDKTYKMDYEDLRGCDEIVDAYYEANNTIKQIIVFGISTGLSKVDMINKSVGEFLDACIEFLTECLGIQVNQDMNLLEKLFLIKYTSKNNPIIPCFRAERQKTSSKYITFCSPEAVEHIVQGLIGRDAKIRETYETEDDATLPDRLLETDKLFDITPEHVGYVFRKINSKLDLGKVGKFAKFRCHMLRKFHASTLLNSDNVTWTVEEIDTLQGRSMDITHQAYFKNSREKLFKKYYDCVDELMLFKQIHGVDETEFEKLKTENNFYKKEIVKNENRMEEQEKRIKQIIENQRELEALLGL